MTISKRATKRAPKTPPTETVTIGPSAPHSDHEKAQAAAHAATLALLEERTIKRPDAPTEMPTEEIRPAYGPNTNGLTDLAEVGHAPNDAERERVARRLAKQHTATEG
jgi:hypothetical protein